MNRVLVILGALVVVLLIIASGLLTGVIPRSSDRDSERPPCDQLPERQEVADALAAHGELATRIRGVGPGMTVDVAAPCDDQPDRAIVRITYATDDEWEGVHAILTQEGFGVAAQVVGD